MFSLPSTVNGEGDTDEKPIHLPGVKSSAFRNLLNIIYPKPMEFGSDGYRGNHPLREFIRKAGSEQLIAVFQLIDMWNFDKIKEVFMEELRSGPWLGVIPKIEFAHRFKIEEWYLPSYRELAQRRKYISASEAERLGISFTMNMAEIRERRIERICKNTLSTPEDDELDTDLKKVFDLVDRTSKHYALKLRAKADRIYVESPDIKPSIVDLFEARAEESCVYIG